MRKKLTGFMTAIGIISALLLSGCGGGNTADVLTNEKLFKSYSTSTYFKYDANGNQALKVTGKPFIAFRYLKSDPKQATDCFFGLYDVSQQLLIPNATYETVIPATAVTFYSYFTFPNDSIVRQYNFGAKNSFQDNNPIITVKENNTTWVFTLNDPSVKATTRVTGTATKINNYGVDTAGGMFKSMDATPTQP